MGAHSVLLIPPSEVASSSVALGSSGSEVFQSLGLQMEEWSWGLALILQLLALVSQLASS